MNFEKIDIWLPPFWLIGVGAFAGLVLLSLGYGVVWLVSRRGAAVLRETATEGVMPSILGFSAIVSVLAAAGTFFIEKPFAILSSVPQLVLVDSGVGVEYPETLTIVIAALGLVVVVLTYVAIRGLLPTISTIAMATSREVIAQKLFWLALVLGIFLLKPLLLPIPSLMHLPYNTFGEDIKMLRDTGVTVVMVLSIVVAIWSAGFAISEELEGRTALTLLSKPVNRRQFIIGKYLGIVWVVGLMFLILGTLLLLTVSCKVVYDAREQRMLQAVSWSECYQAMALTTPGLLLGFLETVVLASISVALSTKLPILANLIVSSSVYAMGHLVPLVVVSAEDRFPVVTFVGQLIAVVLPVLDHFSVPGSTIGGEAVPWEYLAWAGLYSLLYSSIALLIAVAFFENRDLA